MTKKKWYQLILIALAAALLFGATSCDDESDADKTDREFMDRIAYNFTSAQPAHEYDMSQARENLLAAQDALALGADSWTFQSIDGKGVSFQCPSLGFPIPFGAQITNPEKIVDRSEGDVTVSQMEPYGLFPPADVRATLANCVLPNGEIGVFYSEQDLATFMFDVTLNPETGIYEVSQDATTSVKVKKITPEQVNARPAK